jgi:hypothetical protein
VCVDGCDLLTRHDGAHSAAKPDPGWLASSAQAPFLLTSGELAGPKSCSSRTINFAGKTLLFSSVLSSWVHRPSAGTDELSSTHFGRFVSNSFCLPAAQTSCCRVEGLVGKRTAASAEQLRIAATELAF